MFSFFSVSNATFLIPSSLSIDHRLGVLIFLSINWLIRHTADYFFVLFSHPLSPCSPSPSSSSPLLSSPVMSVSMRNPPQRRRSMGPVSPKRIYRNLSVRLRGGESSVAGEMDAPKHLSKSADVVRYLGGSLVNMAEMLSCPLAGFLFWIIRSYFDITCWLCVTTGALSQSRLLVWFKIWFMCPVFLCRPLPLSLYSNSFSSTS